MAVFTSFIGDYTLILLMAIISLVGSIALRSVTIFLAQFFLLIAIFLIDFSASSILYIPISIVQVLLSIFLIYKIIIATDRFYLLVMEKTHQKDTDITKNGDNGSQSSFL